MMFAAGRGAGAKVYCFAMLCATDDRWLLFGGALRRVVAGDGDGQRAGDIA